MIAKSDSVGAEGATTFFRPGLFCAGMWGLALVTDASPHSGISSNIPFTPGHFQFYFNGKALSSPSFTKTEWLVAQ